MKHYSGEVVTNVITQSIRKLEHIQCDECGKKILPTRYRSAESAYLRIHTWHNDWRNDSVESHEYGDYCKNCAKSFLNRYIDEMGGTEEIEVEHRYLTTSDCNSDKLVVSKSDIK